MAYFFAGNYKEALSWAKKVVRDKPNYQLALRIFAAANALTGRQEEAQQTVKLLRQLDPELRISNLKDRYPLRRAEDLARWADGCEKRAFRNEARVACWHFFAVPTALSNVGYRG